MDGLRILVGCFFSGIAFLVSTMGLYGWRANQGVTGVAAGEMLLLAVISCLVGLVGSVAFVQDESGDLERAPWPIKPQLQPTGLVSIVRSPVSDPLTGRSNTFNSLLSP